MFLDVGNVQRIDDPTVEQVGFHLRNLPAKAPFLVLKGDEELYIQAMPEGDEMRVELRQGVEQRYVVVPLEQAQELFRAFIRWDEAPLDAVAWRRLRWFNDRYRLFAIWALMLIAYAAVRLWLALR